MKKRLLSIILTLCMVMSITPLNAFAVTEYGIWIGEEQVTSDKTWSKQGWKFRAEYLFQFRRSVDIDILSRYRHSISFNEDLSEIFIQLSEGYTESDFYEMEIGTSGIMRNYMARKCDIHFPLDHKLRRFLTAAMRVYKVPEEEQAKVIAFIGSLDIRAIATEVMYKLFAMLEMTFDFKLSKDDEEGETR